MKRKIRMLMVLFAAVTGVLCTPVICHAEENADKSDMIAGKEEMLASKEIGVDGMVPVYGEDIVDGTYPIEVDSSSSMFRIIDAQLTVAEGEMTAVITMSGKGYLKLYMGTGEEAVEAQESDYIPFQENENGAHTYTIPVEVLNQELECTAFSKRKEKWYDRQLVFLVETLPKEALLKQLAPASLDVKDGTYTMEVSLSGGTGRAEIVSPTTVEVTENTGIAAIQWDSPYYDYMIVNGEKIIPVNTEGNSLFEIPIWLLDSEMQIIADTTAMSVPYEIEYTLTFHSDTLKRQESKMIWLVCGIILGLGIIADGILRFKKTKAHM